MATVLTPTVKISAPEDSTSKTLATIVTKFQYLSPKQTYFAVWTYSPTAQFNNAKTIVEKIRKSSSAQEAFSVTKFLSDLKPDTGYIIQVDVYEGSVNNNNIVAMDSISFGTKPLGGSLDCVSRSSSVIAMAFTGLNPLEFEARVDMIYKKSGDADKNWKNVEREVISVGETKNITHMFTGLTSATSYDFKIILYKGNSTSNPIATYTKTVSTKAYLPDSTEIVPSFKDVVTVSETGKGYISAEVSNTLPEGYTVHLYKAYPSVNPLTDEDFSDVGALDSNLKKLVTESLGAVVIYKLVVVDDNNEKLTETDMRSVNYNSYFDLVPWVDKVQGAPFDIEGRIMKYLGNAMRELHQYCTLTGLNDGDSDVISRLKETAYGLLTECLPTAVKGNPFVAESSVMEHMDILAQLYANGTAIQRVYTQGTPVYASTINAVVADVQDALATIL